MRCHEKIVDFTVEVDDNTLRQSKAEDVKKNGSPRELCKSKLSK